MNYVNREMKVDQLIGYINADKINLIPAFQRGQVWTPPMRRKLLANMVKGRPIPAIFLYKEESGSMYAYSILDGKQRLESLILFVGNKRSDLRINDVNRFFFGRGIRQLRNFKIELEGKLFGFANLDEKHVREFREYAIPTIEISLEDSSMDEIVELFVDINTYGVKVSRFDVVKAMVKDPLLGSVLDLIAVRQMRGRAIHYKAKYGPINKVLGKLSLISRLQASNARVDRAWERLSEIALFARNGKHTPPVAILKSFIKGGDGYKKLTQSETKRIRAVFAFLSRAYREVLTLPKSKLAQDQPQFYTMVTTLLATDLLTRFSEDELMRKLDAFSRIVDGLNQPPIALEEDVTAYNELAARQTTNVGRREERQRRFESAIGKL